MSDSPPPKTTVAVCTRNRSRSLLDACEATLAVEPPDGGWELLIVDNRSTDDTAEVARELAAREPRVRVEVEPEIGLSAARNAGFRHARGELVVYVDDDAYPEPGWLRALVAAFDREGVLAAGGPVAPRFEGELPGWLGERFLPYLTVWELGPEPIELTYNEYPRGANMAFHRDVFDRFGGFSTQLGRKGGSLLSCEETELCLRIERGGGKVLYVPEARVEHSVDARRIDERWLLDRFTAQGASEAIIDWRHGGWAGLRRGWRRFRRHAEEAARDTSPGAELMARCQRASLRGYTRRALRCPFSVPRYRPEPGEPAPEPWLPFA